MTTRKVLIAALAGLSLAGLAHAQLTFTAGSTVSSGGLPFVNNPIDLNLADFTNNLANQALTGYTATNNNVISGSITRSNLTNGSLLTASQFNTTLASAQGLGLLYGAINFTGGTGTSSATSFIGSNASGALTVTSNTNMGYQLRTFTATGDTVGFNNTNSIGISGTGYLNLSNNPTTLTFNTNVSAVGFTQLQRDGSRTYNWTVNLIDINSLATSSVSLGSISFAGMTPAASSGGDNAENYRYDTFVGYAAAPGFAITGLSFSGGHFVNIDGLSYAVIPEPSSVALLAGMATLGFVALRRRRA